MPLEPGDRIGPYEITGELGAGGMGVVYRARDTKLGREVALKVLPEAFAHDPDRSARFDREARLLASLNHPNIGGIHGLEDSQNTKALVLELVEGPTLADRIKQGPLAADDALAIARQIADALEAAHEAGVIHRDLKPANIKIAPDGTVKVLDFGLAKALDPGTGTEGSDGLSASPTISLTAAATQLGMVIGTAAYMSPEQARGKPVDKRADVWAFGVVLYEMLAGARPFQGEDVSLTLASVMKSEVDVGSLPADVPPNVRTALRQCLAKDPKRRLRDIGDVRLLLEGRLDAGGDWADLHPHAPASSRWAFAALGAVVGIAIGAGALWLSATAGSETAAPPRHLVVTTPAPLDPTVNPHRISLAPDGSFVVFQMSSFGGTRGPLPLHVRRLDSPRSTPIAGTEGATVPFVSPDGQWIGYIVNRGVFRVPSDGGPSQQIVDTGGFASGASWGPDDTIVVFTAGGLLRVDVNSGVSEPLPVGDPAGTVLRATFPDHSPDGRFVAVTLVDEAGRPVIATIRLDTGETRRHGPGTAPRFAPTGQLVYLADELLVAVAFDPATQETKGPPVRIMDEAGSIDTSGGFSIADDGTLAYLTGDGFAFGERSLAWAWRDGTVDTLPAPRQSYDQLALAPDGRRAAAFVAGENDDLWLLDLERGVPERLTFDPAGDRLPTWTVDGEHVLFMSARANGIFNLFRRRADGTGEVERLGSSPRLQGPFGVTPDGGEVLLIVGTVDGAGLGRYDLAITALEPNAEVRPLLTSPFSENQPTVSPDGRWMAYRSDESGQDEIYVRSFPDVERQRIRISIGGGSDPAWSADGRELFFRNGQTLMSVGIPPGDRLDPGPPELVLEGDFFFSGLGRKYAPHPDGERFLVIEGAAGELLGTNEINVVLDWVDELNRRVPMQ